MRLKAFFELSLALIFIFTVNSIQSQSSPTAIENKFRFAVGAGVSGYNPDYGHGHLLGGTLWIDYIPDRIPWILHGISVEVEARDLNYARSQALPGNLRQDTVEGGLVYSWPHFHDFRPYGKFSAGFGNADSETKTGLRYHNSRNFLSGGGGFDYRIARSLWLRVDYEYQSWPDFFKHPAPVTGPAIPSGRLNPQGFTLGAVYRFDTPFSH